MTAQERAQYLIEKFGKQTALQVVFEIERALIDNGGDWDAKYWDDVNEEIQKL